MKTKRTLNAEFGPDTRFEVPPQPAAPFRATLVDELERLKNRLLREALAGAPTESNLPLRRAANAAAARAWLEAYPLLLLPELFSEKARAALAHAGRPGRDAARPGWVMAEAA